MGQVLLHHERMSSWPIPSRRVTLACLFGFLLTGCDGLPSSSAPNEYQEHGTSHSVPALTDDQLADGQNADDPTDNEATEHGALRRATALDGTPTHPNTDEPRWQPRSLSTVRARALFAEGQPLHTTSHRGCQLVSQHTPRGARIIWRGSEATLDAWQEDATALSELTDRIDTQARLCGQPAPQRELTTHFAGGQGWRISPSGTENTVVESRTQVMVARALRRGTQSLLVVYVVPAELREALRADEARYFDELLCEDPT